MTTFKKAEPSTSTETLRPARPNTLNLLNKIDPVRSDLKSIETPKVTSSFSNKNEQISKIPPPPPPRWSKPSTPQNNFTVTTTVTFSVKPESPRNEFPPQLDMVCDPKRMSPEGQCTSSISSKDNSLQRTTDQTPVSNSSSTVLSPLSDPSSLLTPDTLSPLSITKTARHSRRTKLKASKHYQESDILESPTVYYRSAVGDKVSYFFPLPIKLFANFIRPYC